MIQISLNNNESKMLKDVLETYLSDLRMEIANTDKKDFREDLKKTKGFLNGLLRYLEPGLPQR